MTGRDLMILCLSLSIKYKWMPLTQISLIFIKQIILQLIHSTGTLLKGCNHRDYLQRNLPNIQRASVYIHVMWFELLYFCHTNHCDYHSTHAEPHHALLQCVPRRSSYHEIICKDTLYDYEKWPSCNVLGSIQNVLKNKTSFVRFIVFFTHFLFKVTWFLTCKAI